MTELKRCPFCGGKGKINKKIVDYNGRRIYEYMCYCAECFCSTPPYPIKDDAIKVWNNRPSPWHTGTPKEEGWYLVVVEWKDYANKANRRYKYFEFKNNNWIYNQEFGSVDVIAYWGQKIDPYKENEDGRIF